MVPVEKHRFDSLRAMKIWENSQNEINNFRTGPLNSRPCGME